MAMIKCTECNKDISDKAQVCINCGAPIEDISPVKEKKYFDAKTGKERQPFKWELERDGIDTLSTNQKSERFPYAKHISGIFISLVIFTMCSISSNNSQKEAQILRAEKDKAALVKKQERDLRIEKLKKERLEKEKDDKIRGFHCLSPWDGSLADFKRDIKNASRNPKSFQHVETKITPMNKQGKHTAIMAYRAENGFGGMTAGVARAVYNNSDCKYTVLSYE